MPAPDPYRLLEQAAAARGDAATTRRLLPLLELTNLNPAASRAEIAQLCTHATQHGVAALCLSPHALPLARERLAAAPVRLATVANFPDASDDLARIADEVAAAAAAGAKEVDVLIPLEAVLAGDVGLVTELVELCRTAGGATTTLKLVLETGTLRSPDAITAAARAAIMAGADFLTTSLRESAPGATLEAVAILLAVLDEADGRVGLKIAGDLRTPAQAAGHLHLIDHFMGPTWASPTTVRFAAPALLDDLLAVAGR